MRKKCYKMKEAVPNRKTAFSGLQCYNFKAPNKIAADDILMFYFYLSKKIKLDVSSESSAEQMIHLKHQVLFSQKKKLRICCITESATLEMKEKESPQKRLVKFSVCKAKRRQLPQATHMPTSRHFLGTTAHQTYIIECRNKHAVLMFIYQEKE